ncbi:MAG: hypothetical protein WD009_14845 [Phycisphaeraceae bacterium]
MIRAAAVAILLLIVVHLLAGGAFLAWLGATDRLTVDRVRRVVDMFTMTIEEEQQALADAQGEQAQREAQAGEQAYLERVSDGPRTLRDRLDVAQRVDELGQHRVERVQRETADLRRQIERAQGLLARERADLAAEREAFAQALEREQRLREDEDFQQAVRMYEQLRPDQTKQMFQSLMDQGQTQQVVDYLAAMQLRLAGRVLQQFQDTPQEIEQATELIERLRRRGVDPLEALAGERGEDDT